MSGNSHPLVSVVMPMYNVSAYVGCAIGSIASQSWDNLEIVLVDDGSSDDTAAVACAAAEGFGLNYTFHGGSNHGVSVARNVGTSLASGRYVMHLDPDDLLDAEAIKDAVTIMEESSLDVAAMNYRYIDEAAQRYAAYKEEPGFVLSQSEALDAHLLRSLNLAAPCFVVERRFALDHPYRESVRYSEDIQHAWDVLLSVDRIGYVRTERYGYRVRPGSTMTASGLGKVGQGIVDFKAFAEALPDDKVNRGWVYGRWLLGTLHVMAKRLCWEDWRSLASLGGLSDAMQKLFDFPQAKIRALALLASTSPRLSYEALSRVQ